jgi:phosphate:Na+ symporter
MTDDVSIAMDVINMKQELQRLTDWATIHQADRLVADEPNRLSCYTVEVDIIEKLKRIYYFAKRMAKTVVAETEVEEQEELAAEQ